LSRDRAIASVGRKPLGDESAVGETKEDAPVQEQWLMERVLERSNLISALRQVKSNAGSPGADGMRVEALSDERRAVLARRPPLERFNEAERDVERLVREALSAELSVSPSPLSDPSASLAWPAT